MRRSEGADSILDRRRAELTDDARRSVAGPRLLRSLRGATRYVVTGIPPLVRLGWRLSRKRAASTS